MLKMFFSTIDIGYVVVVVVFPREDNSTWYPCCTDIAHPPPPSQLISKQPEDSQVSIRLVWIEVRCCFGHINKESRH